MKKFVVLETLSGPSKGSRFYSTNSNPTDTIGSIESKNNTNSAKGELWYKEIAFCDTSEECKKYLKPMSLRDILISVGLGNTF